MIPWPLLKRQVEEHAYPLVFATISGAHLYGFPSPDSDFDLRGAHVLPLNEVVGLKTVPDTIEKSGIQGGIEIDLVTTRSRSSSSCFRRRTATCWSRCFRRWLFTRRPSMPN